MKKKKIKFNTLIVTRGKSGITIYKKKLRNNFSKVSLSAFELKPIDTIGAGDSVLGIASLLDVKNISIEVMAFLGNIFGALTTKYLGHSSHLSKKDVSKTHPKIQFFRHLGCFLMNFWKAPGPVFCILDDFGPSKITLKRKETALWGRFFCKFFSNTVLLGFCVVFRKPETLKIAISPRQEHALLNEARFATLWNGAEVVEN